MWLAVVAIVANALFALRYLATLSPVQLEEREDLGEHAASVHFNVLFLLVIVLYLFRGSNRAARLVLLLLCLPVGYAYLLAERRSAVVAFAVGLLLVVLSLWWRNRRQFFVVFPILLLFSTGYIAAFWNSEASAGFPAQAVKTVISEDQASAKDRSSDLYRDIENFDLNFTIQSSPITGLGFGQKFLRPVPLPDISAFEFYEYIPHNSILWIWIKTGFFGFLSMLTLFALAMREGVKTLARERDPTYSAFVLVSVAYVCMYAIFAFVDIAWDPRSMVFLALAMAFCTQRTSGGEPVDPIDAELRTLMASER